MVDISGIGQSLGLDATAAAGAVAAAGVVNKEKKVRKRPALDDKGLGLEDIPDDIPAVPVENAEVAETAETESTETVEAADNTEAAEKTNAVYDDEENTAALAKIDYELASLQVMLKKVISKKIAMADKHNVLKHKLLVSVFEDCKNAYQKIKEVRDLLG
jgi:hypothetical protein